MKDLGSNLPLDYKLSESSPQKRREKVGGRGNSINSDLFSVSVLKGGRIQRRGLKIDFKLRKLISEEYSVPVYWNGTNITHGYWGDEGCTVIQRYLNFNFNERERP